MRAFKCAPCLYGSRFGKVTQPRVPAGCASVINLLVVRDPLSRWTRLFSRAVIVNFRRFAALAAAGALVVMSSSPATRAQAGSVVLTALDVPYVQDFNTLASSGTSSSLPAGWEFVEAGTNANTIYTAGTGSGNAGDTYSFGGAGSIERAFGGLQSGSLIPTIGAVFTNSTDQTITSIDISYTGEQWRLGATGRADRLDFQVQPRRDVTERRQPGSTSMPLDFNSPVDDGIGWSARPTASACG